MDQEALIAAMKGLVEALASDISAKFDEVSTKHKELSDSVAKIAADAAGARIRGKQAYGDNEDGEDGTREFGDAHRTAADAVADVQHDVRVLAATVEGIRKNQTRPMDDLDKFADAQARADRVLHSLGTAAEPPMSGETLINYNIRMHRKMQPHSKRWKDVELKLLASDQRALDGICDQIRADAMEASLSPVGMPEFQHRMITKTSPGGHTIREFIGNGTIIKQMARTPRHLATINTTNSMRTR
jgi:hypothetical protein